MGVRALGSITFRLSRPPTLPNDRARPSPARPHRPKRLQLRSSGWGARNYPPCSCLGLRHHRGQSVLCPGAVLAPACFLSAASKSVFPVTPVKKATRMHLDRIKIVEAAGVDAKILRIGAGNVEGMDAAMAAEGMLRDAGIEAIGGEIVTAAQQLELPGRDANVKDALLSADRAVAFAHGRLLPVDADAEPHPAAMATALVCLQHFPTPVPFDALQAIISAAASAVSPVVELPPSPGVPTGPRSR